MITKDQLDQLAHKALEVSNGTAEWLAVDKDGNVTAYIYFADIIKATDDNWTTDDRWVIGKTDAPQWDRYKKHNIDIKYDTYEISRLLSNHL